MNSRTVTFKACPNIYNPVFTGTCRYCNEKRWSPDLAVCEVPGVFMCSTCVRTAAPGLFEDMRIAAAGQFNRLTPAAKRRVRIIIYGSKRAKEMEQEAAAKKIFARVLTPK